MSLITPLDKDLTTPVVKEKLENIEEAFGMLPNIIGVMAHSEATLDMYMSMEGALDSGHLTKPQREMIALAVSQANECRYCVSAHTEFCSGLGLDTADIIKSRLCEADNPIEQAMLDLAVSIVENRGQVPEEQVTEAKEAGLSNSLILEVFSNVIFVIMGNYINHLTKIDIDFPVCTLDL
tara:strand:+ start:2713 stop:3252 length:540 start_codon:yes stop_codon:yes gene_type:complete